MHDKQQINEKKVQHINSRQLWPTDAKCQIKQQQLVGPLDPGDSSSSVSVESREEAAKSGPKNRFSFGFSFSLGSFSGSNRVFFVWVIWAPDNVTP